MTSFFPCQSNSNKYKDRGHNSRFSNKFAQAMLTPVPKGRINNSNPVIDYKSYTVLSSGEMTFETSKVQICNFRCLNAETNRKFQETVYKALIYGSDQRDRVRKRVV